MIREYVHLGLPLSAALEIGMLTRSSYYYRTTGGKKGMPASTHTLYQGALISNEQVVKRIKEILEPEFIDYGYKRTTSALKAEGYQIGKTKVYRLMKEHELLHPKVKGKHPGRKFVVYTSPHPSGPFQVIETDIKYVYIPGILRNAYLITMFDTFHRQAYVWGLFSDMKTDKVIRLILEFIDQYLIPNGINPKEVEVIIRTDNGSQFIAESYKKLLKDSGILSNYIPPASPQMNGHIEAFHNTVQKLVCNKYVFTSLTHAKEVFEKFFHTYNHIRIMEAILDQSPVNFLKLWKEGRIEVRKESGKNRFYFKGEGKHTPPPPPEVYSS